jgi:phosphoribosylformylglycinamidine synthase
MGFDTMDSGDVLLLVGETKGSLGATLYMRIIENREDGAPPPVDLDTEKANGDFVRTQIRAGNLKTAHDLSDGGLAGAVIDMALASNTGAKLAYTGELPAFAWLFGEDQARYLLSVTPEQAEIVMSAAKSDDIPVSVIGLAGGNEISLNGQNAVSLNKLRSAYEDWMPSLMASDTEGVAAE